MITPNNNAIIWRNLAKKLRLRQVIVGRQVTGTWFKGTSGYKKPPPREEMAASFLRGCSCVQASFCAHLFTTLIFQIELVVRRDGQNKTKQKNRYQWMIAILEFGRR